MNSGPRGGNRIFPTPGSDPLGSARSPDPSRPPDSVHVRRRRQFEPPVLEAPPPDRIGKYQVIRKLGDGATSEVFLCHDEFAGRDVAVKIVYQDRLNDPQGGKVFRKLFVTEASLAGKLAHPHIAQIYDAVVGDKMSYIVMEYVAGGTLEPFCAPENLLPIDKIVEIAFKATRALDFAHKLGVTHRDIKPANILLVGAGGTDIKITDFGSAIMSSGDTTQVTGIGSPAYMSPQQIKEHPLDHRTDIYSLGVVMYQLLTGVLPFNARNNFSMMYQITTVEPPPPSAHRKEIPPALDAIVKKAMEKDHRAALPDLGRALVRAGRDPPLGGDPPAHRRGGRQREVQHAAGDGVLQRVHRRRAVGGAAHQLLAGRCAGHRAHLRRATPATSSASSPRAR